MANRNGIGSTAVQVMTTAFVILSIGLTTTLLQAQPNQLRRDEPIDDDLADSEESTTTYQRPSLVEPFVTRNGVAVVRWPEKLVGHETLMAIDLSNGSVKWTHPFDTRIMLGRAFGEFIFVRTPGGAIRQEWMLRMDSGEAAENHEIEHDDPGSWLGTPVANDRYLVSDHVYLATNGKVLRKLGFSWDQAFIDRDKLYTIGDPDGEAGRFDQSTREQLLRRTDLTTGVTELTVPLKSTKSFDGLGSSFVLIAGRADEVVLQFIERVEWNKHNYLLLGYQMAGDTVLWKTFPPCQVREAMFREDGQLECQCRGGDAIFGWTKSEVSKRQPLLVNFETGSCRMDHDWKDPFAFVGWYSETMPVGYLQRNDQYTLAIFDPTPQRSRHPTRGDIICLNSNSGSLLWQKEVYGRWPTTSDSLGDYIVRPLEGGIEIIEVATGNGRTVKAKDVGLNVIRETQVPREFALDPVPALLDRNHDWWQDRLILWAPVLPLFAWAAFQLFRWRRAGSPKISETKTGK